MNCALQVRWTTKLTSEEYVSRQHWQHASLPVCPLHPGGGCSYSRHGSYVRVKPKGTLIPRWYCPDGHATISLLPDCFASRLTGTLVDLEQVVATAEAAGSLTLVAHELRGARWCGALRWLRRRARLVRQTLLVVVTLLPEAFIGCAPTLTIMRAKLRLPVDECLLVRLREMAAAHLGAMPPPVGFGPRTWKAPRAKRRCQQQTGPPRRRRQS